MSRALLLAGAAWLVFGGINGLSQEATAQGPTIQDTALRGRILLNGVWRFQPAVGASENSPQSDEWGTIPVPGSWMGPDFLPGVLTRGSGWGDIGASLGKAWYERKITIPADWQGRSLVVDFRRISTDGEVFVDGKSCGMVYWPYGEVDITAAAVPGKEVTLRVLVTATADEGESLARMGYAVEKSVKNTLNSAGLTGEVWLLSRPSGPHITDIFVQPSVRGKKIALEVELYGIAAAGDASFTARMLDESGKEEMTFEGKAPLQAKPLQTVTLEWPWENPRLWDVGQPNLYKLVLEVKGAGWEDSAAQRFGFRELWIEGRDFYLNGSKIRWRPMGGHSVPATIPQMDALFEGGAKAGFNISQIWPEDSYARGHANAWELVAERASEKGWPIIAAATHFGRFMDDGGGKDIWKNPEGKERYRKVIQADLRRFRNEPSVMMYGTTANIMNHAADQNPRYIGQQKKTNETAGRMERFEEALEIIREADPLRPVFIHAGNRAGDLYSVNHYLNLIPLQEREEWFSEYAKDGDVPYIGIEFGTPFNTNMNRGRLDFGNAHVSEPQLTENTAAYLGAEAYRLEPRNYRRNIRFGFNGKNWAGDWGAMQRLQSQPPAFQAMHALFVRNTWRAWRTWGVTGGMIPWNMNYQMWAQAGSEKVPSAPWEPGQRGVHLPEDTQAHLSYLREPGWKTLESGKVLQEVNGSTLAWIAGNAEAFTEKAHHFRDGQTVRKQIVLINDQRTDAAYTSKWTVRIGDKVLQSKDATGTIAPGTNLSLPVEFAVPAGLTEKTEGEISLTANIGGREHTDTFPFTVFPASGQPVVSPRILLFDPVGRTTAMLKALGVSFTPWSGQPSRDALLIIGREALSSRAALPGSLETFVSGGGRALVMTQTPEYFRESLGFRVSRFQSRRAFRIDQALPVFAGLNDDNLRDWAGQGTLLEARPNYDVTAQFNFPPYGWRWGSRHTVTSAALEKPHLTGWRPLLEAEFDLAYSPLMQLDYGKGRVTLCTLDLEDQIPADPAAEKLARQLINFAGSAPLTTRATKTLFVGSPEAFKLFAASGIIAENVVSWPGVLPAGSLVVIDSEVKPPMPQVVNFAKAGGRVLFLARTSAENTILPLKKALNFYLPETQPKSPFLAGLSLSDLRLRSELDWWVLGDVPGVETGGLFAVQPEGRGVIVHTQLNPLALDVAKFPWLRYTRWRQTRAINQVLANLGATFAADARLFHPMLTRMSLEGGWKLQMTAPLPLRDWRKKEEGYADPGISSAARAAVAEKFDDSAWSIAAVPSWFPPLNEQSGEFVARRYVDIPAEWNGEVLRLGLARIKSFDTVYWNGQPIGSTDQKTENSWNHIRRYRVPGNLVRTGRNVIAVRGFATDYQGGIHGTPDELYLQLIADDKQPARQYHPDYKEDPAYGDEPSRYYRW